MMSTYASAILNQLRSSGFTVEKCSQESQWQIRDNGSVLMWSRSLGDLAKKAAEELGIDGKEMFDKRLVSA